MTFRVRTSFSSTTRHPVEDDNKEQDCNLFGVFGGHGHVRYCPGVADSVSTGMMWQFWEFATYLRPNPPMKQKKSVQGRVVLVGLWLPVSSAYSTADRF